MDLISAVDRQLLTQHQVKVEVDVEKNVASLYFKIVV